MTGLRKLSQGGMLACFVAGSRRTYRCVLGRPPGRRCARGARVSGFGDRLKNNTALRVLAVYLGASWVVLQVVDVVKQNMGRPDGVFPFALVLLVIGLPVMLVTAILQAGPSKGSAVAGSTDSGESSPEPGPETSGELSPRRLFTWRNAMLGERRLSCCWPWSRAASCTCGRGGSDPWARSSPRVCSKSVPASCSPTSRRQTRCSREP